MRTDDRHPVTETLMGVVMTGAAPPEREWERLERIGVTRSEVEQLRRHDVPAVLDLLGQGLGPAAKRRAIEAMDRVAQACPDTVEERPDLSTKTPEELAAMLRRR